MGCVLACLAFDLRHNLNHILLGRSMVLFAVMYWYLLEAVRLPRDLSEYTQAEYDFGLFCVGISVFVFLVAYHRSRLTLFSALTRRLPILDDPRVLWRLLLGAMAIGFMSLVIYVNFDLSSFFQGLFGLSRRWTGNITRGRYGSWRSIFYEMQMFLQAAVPFAICLVFMRRVPWGQKVVAATFVVWMLLHAFASGARGLLGPIILCLAAAIFWRASPRLRRMLIVAGIPLALVGGYYVSAMIVVGRNEGKFELSNASKAEVVGFEMFRELLFLIRAEENGLSPQYGLTYFTQLVNPIPRVFWPGKPVADAGLILARAYGTVDRSGEPTMTRSPGLLGEAYMNFGLLGLFIIPAMVGIVVRAWDRMWAIAKRSIGGLLVFALGLTIIFLSARSINFSAFYGLLALFVLLMVFEKMGWTGTRSRVVDKSPVRRRRSVRPKVLHAVTPRKPQQSGS